MKGFLGGLFVAAPATALILFLTMGGQHELRTQQERQYTQQRIDELQFDQEFDQVMGTSSEELSEKREEKIADLEEKKEDLDRQWEKQVNALGDQLDDMDEALQEQEPKELEW